MSLRDRLIARIAKGGPIGVADFMNACLHDPEGGYYATRPALGEAGDFITAPHVSQMFGELIGLWAAEVWERLGRPARARLVELGPGDGTMMGDMLRAARAAPGFLDACEVVFIETSAPLKGRQEEVFGDRARWLGSLGEVPWDAPVILVANEFLDCLPIRQAVRDGEAWRERLVGVDGRGKLAFEIAQSIYFPPHPPHEGEGEEGGDVFEWSEALIEFGGLVGELIARASGAGLVIDYGRDASGLGDTLQALRGHARDGALETPGLADLTAHVDFPAFLAAARAAGAETGPIRSQRAFLRDLGIEQRAATLAHARPDEACKIARQLNRLIAPDQMGALFKAACVYSPWLAAPGFEAE
ncbi:MAG: SAM-dependent methyltransferase [Caulobacteraceae bacterium]|nr:SAM-dependent methyltransferase [Caulobacteraceae bacterium]